MNKYLYMINEEIEFDRHDITLLSIYCGYYKRFLLKRKITFSFISFFVFLIIILIFFKNKYPLYILNLLLSILIYFTFSILPYEKRRKDYENILNKKYDEIFKEYEGYKKEIIKIKTNISKKFRTEEAILLTNGYRMIISEDPLTVTKYNLNNHYLKVMTNRVLDLNHIDIKLNDIKNYKLVGKIINDKENIAYDYVSSLDDKIILTLNDFSILEISSNAYKYFKEALPLKEEKNEK